MRLPLIMGLSMKPEAKIW